MGETLRDKPEKDHQLPVDDPVQSRDEPCRGALIRQGRLAQALASFQFLGFHRLDFMQQRIHVREPGVFLIHTAELALRVQPPSLET